MKNKAKRVSGKPEHGKRASWVRSYHGYGTYEMLQCTRSWLFSCISWVGIKMLGLYCLTRFFSHFYFSRSLVDMRRDELHWHYVPNRTMCDPFVFNKFRFNIIPCFIRPEENPGIKIIEHFLALSKYGPEITW